MNMFFVCEFAREINIKKELNESLLREIWRVFHSLEFSPVQYINHRRWIAFISFLFFHLFNHDSIECRHPSTYAFYCSDLFIKCFSSTQFLCVLSSWHVFLFFLCVMISRYVLYMHILLIFITFYVTAECCVYVSNSLISPGIVHRIFNTHFIQLHVWYKYLKRLKNDKIIYTYDSNVFIAVKLLMKRTLKITDLLFSQEDFILNFSHKKKENTTLLKGK